MLMLIFGSAAASVQPNRVANMAVDYCWSHWLEPYLAGIILDIVEKTLLKQVDSFHSGENFNTLINIFKA